MVPRLQISAHDINRAIRSFRDRDDLFAEVDGDTLRLDVARGPGEVVRKFLPRGHWGAVVDEGYETALRVEIVQEGYRGLGVAKSRKIFEPTFADGLNIRAD